MDLEKPGRKKTPDAALVIALNRGCEVKDALQQLDALRNQRIEGRLAVLWSGVGSQVWELKPARLMERSIDTLKTKYKSFQLLHNLPARSFSLLESQSFRSTHKDDTGWDPRVAQAFTLCIKTALAGWESVQFPVGKEEQQRWVLKCLLHSTRGFSKPGVAAKVCDEVQRLLPTVVRGKEAEHLAHVLEFCDFRGSEVSLRDGTVNEGNRQIIPYPAIVWAWRSVQSYTWHQPHHIKVLELVAFFNYLRACVRRPGNHSSRILHVVDSRVASCVIAKGRSSSCKLNRILRRVGALLLASDVYVFPLWTVSGWNFADAGTRALCPSKT